MLVEVYAYVAAALFTLGLSINVIPRTRAAAAIYALLWPLYLPVALGSIVGELGQSRRQP